MGNTSAKKLSRENASNYSGGHLACKQIAVHAKQARQQAACQPLAAHKLSTDRKDFP
jgi:hypothetical protein